MRPQTHIQPIDQNPDDDYSPRRHNIHRFVPVISVIAFSILAIPPIVTSFAYSTDSPYVIAPLIPRSETAQYVPLLSATSMEPVPIPRREEGILFADADYLFQQNNGIVQGEISVYVVKEGDTLSQIAKMFGVSQNTILWANDIKSANLIQPGTILNILPISGVRHTVVKGDTIASLAKKYKGDESEIVAYNQLSSELKVGEVVVIPNGVIEQRAIAKGTGSSAKTSAGLIHPLPNGRKTQGVHGYNGVDFGAPTGTAIRAAAGGAVIISASSGYNGGYGQYIVIKHANGTQTLYSHLSQNYVRAGATVSQGHVIGAVGNTGRSTGPHLHFEVRGGRNPF